MPDTQFGKRKSILKRIPGLAWTILLFVLVIGIFLFAVTNISEDTADREETALTTALNRAIVNCYCVEGTYPPSLDYIKTNYGLIYDEDIFFVDYRAIGSNLLPDVTIVRKEQ